MKEQKQGRKIPRPRFNDQDFLSYVFFPLATKIDADPVSIYPLDETAYDDASHFRRYTRAVDNHLKSTGLAKHKRDIYVYKVDTEDPRNPIKNFYPHTALRRRVVFWDSDPEFDGNKLNQMMLRARRLAEDTPLKGMHYLNTREPYTNTKIADNLKGMEELIVLMEKLRTGKKGLDLPSA